MSTTIGLERSLLAILFTSQKSAAERFGVADNVRVIPDAGDVVTVGADTIAKLSAQTSRPRSAAAWDQRIVMCGHCVFLDFDARHSSHIFRETDGVNSWISSPTIEKLNGSAKPIE